jgi:hypothetical protein
MVSLYGLGMLDMVLRRRGLAVNRAIAHKALRATV